MSESAADKQKIAEMERTAAQRASDRAKVARWDLDIAVLLFAVLILIIILLFGGISTVVVAPVAIFGLSMAWLVGWRKGRKLYSRFYGEEILRLRRELKREVEESVEEAIEEAVEEAVEETIEEKIKKALRERLE